MENPPTSAARSLIEIAFDLTRLALEKSNTLLSQEDFDSTLSSYKNRNDL
jgi:hypothetical protein